MMTNKSISILFVLIQLVLLFPSFIRCQKPKRHNNTRCTTATIVPSNTTLPYINNPTVQFFRAESVREPNNTFAACPPYSGLRDARFAWYQWTPKNSGFYDILATSSRFYPSKPFDDFDVTVIQGESCQALNNTVLLCLERPAQRSVYLERGMNYYFAIIAFIFSGRDFYFTIQRTPPPPRNDECSNAIRIPSSLTFPYATSEIDVTGVTINRKMELVPTCDRNFNNQSITQVFGALGSYWYVWTPSATGYYNLDVLYNTTICNDSFSCGFDVFPTIAVYENGNSFNCNQTSTWKEFSCKANDITFSIAEFVAGKTYYIQILPSINFFVRKNFYTLKQVRLSIQRRQAPPVNDLCINAIPIDPINGLNISSIDTTHASADLFDVRYQQNFVTSRDGIWFKYNRAIGVPIINFTICDSTRNIDTRSFTAHVLKGNNDCTSLQFVQRFGNVRCPQYFDFLPIEENTTYYILVDEIKRAPFQVSFLKNYFKVINAVSDEIVTYDLSMGATYNDYGIFGETPLATSKVNIEAYFHPEYGVNSVYVTFDKPFRSRCERKFPYSIFGDRNGDFYNATIPLGSHYVTATPYTRSDCKGTIPTSPLKQNFTVTGCIFYLEFEDRTFVDDNTSILGQACDARVTGDAFTCFIRFSFIENVQLKIIDTNTNKSLPGETIPYIQNGIQRFSFGQRNTSAPYSVNPTRFLPGNYTFTYTLDGIEHPPIRFSSLISCPPYVRQV